MVVVVMVWWIISRFRMLYLRRVPHEMRGLLSVKAYGLVAPHQAHRFASAQQRA